MWEDLGPDVVTQLSTMSDAFNSTTSSANELNKVQYNNLFDAMKGIGREIQVSLLKPLESDLMPKVNEIIPHIKEQMPQLKDSISSMASNVIDKVGSLFNYISQHKEQISQIKDTIVNVLSKASSVVGSTVKFIIEHFNTLKPILTTVLAGFLAFKGVSSVVGGINNVGNAIKNTRKAINLIKDGWQILKGLNFASSISKVVNIVKIGIKGISSALSVLMAHPVILTITLVIGALVLLYTKCEWFRNGVNAVVTFIWNKIKGIVDWGRNSAIPAVKSIIDTISNIIGYIADWISNKITWIKDNVIAPIRGWLNEHIVQPVQDLYNSIPSIIEGIVGWISNKINWFRDNIIAPIRNWINDYILEPISSAIEWVKDHLKLPHFKMDGEFSLNPPSMPSIGVDWYYNEGVFDSPTVIGNIGVGDRFNGQGSDQEAILKTRRLYGELENIYKKYNQQPVIVNPNITIECKDKKMAEFFTVKVKENIDKEQNMKRF